MDDVLTIIRASKGFWGEPDLVRRLCHILETAQRTVVMLAPHGYADALDEVGPEKVVVETALLLLLAAETASR
jgi:hypothetical protein